MRGKGTWIGLVGIVALVAPLWPRSAAAQEHEHPPGTATARGLQIPESIRLEHEAIHAALVAATGAPGEVGAAARELAAVLHPHFEREEEIALPPLGLLAPLAAGEELQEAVVAEALAMTAALRQELPRMLAEHEGIRAAVAALGAAAEAAGAADAARLAEELALHARTEEEVLYPAAVAVGDLLALRARAGE